MTFDIDLSKHYKNIPVANIPIRPVDELTSHLQQNVAVVLLALDHVAEVESFLYERLPRGSRLVYLLPDLRIVSVG